MLPRYQHHSPDYTSPDGSRCVTWDSSSLPPLQASAVPRGWELNPKPSTVQYLRRILNSVISLADTYKTWWMLLESNQPSCSKHVMGKYFCPLVPTITSELGAPGWNRTTTPCLQNRTSATKDTRAITLVPRDRIELPYPLCKSGVLPLN